MIDVPRHVGPDAQPSLSWKPVHASTRDRFKATLVCSRGHKMTLRGHEIAADGTASPSVVCPVSGCDFHEFIRLDGWPALAQEPLADG